MKVRRKMNLEGEIPSHEVYVAKVEQPSVATFLSQGAVVGALIGFLSLVAGMLSHPENGYNFFLMFYLLPMVLSGMILGAFEASIIWACTHLAGHRLNIFLRAGIGIVVHAALMTLMTVVLAERALPQEDVSTAYYLWAICFYIGFGLVFGLLVGSRFKPWSELLRGTTSAPELSVEAGLTGFALRVVVIFGFMESVLNLIWQQQRDEVSSEYTIAVIAVVHFIAAGVIVFARMRTSLLVPLALVVNVPIVLYFTEVLTGDDGGMRILSIFYLSVWFVFLATRLIGMSPSDEKSITT
jgi:hypothetical protein